MEQSEIDADKLVIFARDTLAPMIVKQSATIRKKRRISESILSEMKNSGYFHMLLPASIGGLEKHPLVAAEVISILSEANASVGWSQMNLACSRIAGDMPRDEARKIFASYDDIVAWGPPMSTDATVERVDGGYEVSGTWKFASGSAFATWFGIHVPVAPGETRTLLVPSKEVTVIEDWLDVLGLPASSSNSYKVKAFVPDPRVIKRETPGVWDEKHPIFAFPSFLIAIMYPAAVARGIGRGMLNDWKKVANITRHNTSVAIGSNPHVLTETGIDATALWAADSFFCKSIADAYQSAVRFGELTGNDCLKIRSSSSLLIKAAKDLVIEIQDSVGSRGVHFDNSQFAERLTDIFALNAQHQASKEHFKNIMSAWLSDKEEDKKALIRPPVIKPPKTTPRPA